MRNKNIINLLGIQEKLVKNIERGQNFINIYVETKPKEHIYPCCKSKTKYVHDYRTQKIQHISISHVASYIILKKRRYACHNCSKRFYEHYDFLQKNFRKSNTLFDNVVEDLKKLKNIKIIAEDNHISSTVVRYMHFATILEGKFNLVPLPEKIGIDEFKGNVNGTKYQFHVFDLDTHKTIKIIESRTYDVLETFFSKYTFFAKSHLVHFCYSKNSKLYLFLGVKNETDKNPSHLLLFFIFFRIYTPTIDKEPKIINLTPLYETTCFCTQFR